jgi:hypothetical protein
MFFHPYPFNLNFINLGTFSYATPLQVSLSAECICFLTTVIFCMHVLIFFQLFLIVLYKRSKVHEEISKNWPFIHAWVPHGSKRLQLQTLLFVWRRNRYGCCGWKKKCLTLPRINQGLGFPFRPALGLVSLPTGLSQLLSIEWSQGKVIS